MVKKLPPQVNGAPSSAWFGRQRRCKLRPSKKGRVPDRAACPYRANRRVSETNKEDRDACEIRCRPWFHVATAAVFVLAMAVGYRYGSGLDFVQGWGGGIAAVIATFFLVFKSQGYWAWMIVNAALWTYLFFHVGLPMLAYLQISFLIFAGYGAVQWASSATASASTRACAPT